MDFGYLFFTVGFPGIIVILSYVIYWLIPLHLFKKKGQMFLVLITLLVLWVALVLNILKIQNNTQKIVEAETLKRHQGRPLLVLEDGADYKITYSLDKENKSSEFLLILQKKQINRYEKYYAIFRGAVRNQKRKYFEKVQDLPTFFKARVETFLEPGDDDTLVETTAYILYETIPF